MGSNGSSRNAEAGDSHYTILDDEHDPAVMAYGRAARDESIRSNPSDPFHPITETPRLQNRSSDMHDFRTHVYSRSPSYSSPRDLPPPKRLSKVAVEKFKKWVTDTGYWDKGYSTRDFVVEVIQPRCKALRCRLVDVLDEITPDESDYNEAGELSFGYSFVCHRWDAQLKSLLSDPRFFGPFFLDVCCANQIERACDYRQIAFEIERAKRLYVLVDPAGDIFNRIWCLFEIVTAVITNVSIEFLWEKEAPGHYDAWQFWNKVLKRGIDISMAEATEAEDQASLLDWIERQYGTKRVNNALREKLEEQVAYSEHLLKKLTTPVKRDKSRSQSEQKNENP